MQVRVHDPHRYACAHTIKTLEPALTALGILRRCAKCALWSFCPRKSVRLCGMRALSTDHKTQSARDNHLHSRHQTQCTQHAHDNTRPTTLPTVVPMRTRMLVRLTHARTSHTHLRYDRLLHDAAAFDSTGCVGLVPPGRVGLHVARVSDGVSR